MPQVKKVEEGSGKPEIPGRVKAIYPIGTKLRIRPPKFPKGTRIDENRIETCERFGVRKIGLRDSRSFQLPADAQEAHELIVARRERSYSTLVPWGKVPTVFGDFLAEWDSKGIRSLVFPGDFSEMPTEEASILEILRRELNEYFLGQRADFTVPLSLSGPPFFVQVWKELLKIPYGERVTYGELASSMGRPGAARAVGQALARNPLPILIPCHRVVGKHGLGGFGPGLHWKKRLLELEQTYREKFSPR